MSLGERAGAGCAVRASGARCESFEKGAFVKGRCAGESRKVLAVFFGQVFLMRVNRPVGIEGASGFLAFRSGDVQTLGPIVLGFSASASAWVCNVAGSHGTAVAREVHYLGYPSRKGCTRGSRAGHAGTRAYGFSLQVVRMCFEHKIG